MLMTVDDLSRELKVSQRHIWALVAAGRFPQPQRLGRSVRWPKKTVEQFVEAGMDMVKFEGQRREVAP